MTSHDPFVGKGWWADAETIGVVEAKRRTLERAVQILVSQGFPEPTAREMIFGKSTEQAMREIEVEA